MPNTKVKPTKITAKSSSSAKKPQLDVTVRGNKEYPNPVDAFIKAKQAEAKAKADIKEVKPLLEKAATKALFKHNTENPTGWVTSANCVDKGGTADKEHAHAQVQFKSQYSPVDAAAATELLDSELGVDDPNDYLVEVITAKFNDAIFAKDDGGFNASLFKKFKRAIDKVAQEAGIDTPLLMEKKVVPKPDFHGRRWLDFDADDQEALSKILPNSVSLLAKIPKPKA